MNKDQGLTSTNEHEVALAEHAEHIRRSLDAVEQELSVVRRSVCALETTEASLWAALEPISAHANKSNGLSGAAICTPHNTRARNF